MRANQSTDDGNGEEQQDPLAASTPTLDDDDDHALSFRGFSTSIHDMFWRSQTERTDCCSITCCGILQSDRDRFLLRGIRPPSLWMRFRTPLAIILLTLAGAVIFQDPVMNASFVLFMLLLMVCFLLHRFLAGVKMRRDMRKDLLWTKHQMLQDQEQPPANAGESASAKDADATAGQTDLDIRCAHPSCIFGCYPEDRSAMQVEERRSVGSNLCRCLWNSFNTPCCGMHVQYCGGVYGLAQEARDFETMISTAHCGRVDYITMEAFNSYYPSIYRRKWEIPASADDETVSLCSKIKDFLPPLSRLSLLLLRIAGALTFVFWIWTMIETSLQPNFVLYLAVVGECVGLLWLICWAIDDPIKAQLSCDAIIKFFFVGFIYSTTLGIVCELALNSVLKHLLELAVRLSGTNHHEASHYNIWVIDPDHHQVWQYEGNYNHQNSKEIGDPTAFLLNSFGPDAIEADIIKVAKAQNPIIYIVYTVIKAFVVASFVEEVSKYFGYRLIEHPDFLTQNELEEAKPISPFISNQSSNFGTTNIEREESRDEIIVGEESGLKEPLFQRGAQEENIAPPDYSKQNKSFRARGAAITQAMVAVAMGFTCFENLLYIFFYSGESIEMEWAVFVARCAFPVHPLAAAIQSIGVCQRDLEEVYQQSSQGQRRGGTQIGRILLPAVIFHGFYDFFIMMIDFLKDRHNYLADNSFLISTSISFAVIGTALLYYCIQGYKQCQRFFLMDQRI